ncbi:MAG: pilin [Candidatus Paceibacterota bacterium]
MKKILSTLALISFLFFLVAPAIVSAEGTEGPSNCCKMKRALTVEGTPCGAGSIVGTTVGDSCGSLGTVTCGTPYWGAYCLINTLNNITDWVFVVLIALAGLFVIIGAFTFVTSAGDPEKTKKGREYILYAAIGLAVAFLAKAVPGLVKLISGF